MSKQVARIKRCLSIILISVIAFLVNHLFATILTARVLIVDLCIAGIAIFALAKTIRTIREEQAFKKSKK